MFGRKKQAPAENPTRSGKGKPLMQQMGWTDVEDMQSAVMGDDDDDELEAELLALTQGSPTRKPPPKKRSPGMAAVEQLDHMVSQCMKDLPDDDDDDGLDDEDLDDPDLLAELGELESDEDEPPPAKQPTPPPKQAKPSPPAKLSSPPASDVTQLLQERLENYKSALANATVANDGSKKRRAERGLKTLNDLLKKAKAGKAVIEEDLEAVPMMAVSAKPSPKPSPEDVPMVFEPTITKVEPPAGNFSPTNQQIKAPSPPAATPAPAPVARPTPAPKPQAPAARPTSRQITVPASLSAKAQSTYMMLATRKEQYHAAAVKAVSDGDKLTAAKHLRTSKQFDAVIEALVAGKEIDLAEMPPPPPGIKAAASPPATVVRESLAGSASSSSLQSPDEEELPQTTAEEKKKLYHAPESASSTLEALQQRLAKYKSAATEATQEGNASKAKRHGRIVKQYETAIKDFKKGKPVDYEELPTPPGFPDIPRPSGSAAGAAAAAQKMTSPPAAAAASTSGSRIAAPTPQGTAANRQPSPKPNTLHRQMSTLSRAEQQTIFLQERQLEFRKAALKAKQNKDLELAKKYLKSSKGFDQMIIASQAGLPVNMNEIPPPPGVKESVEGFVEVEGGGGSKGATGGLTGDREEQYKNLEQDMIQQIRMCATNSEHFTKLGDVSSASKFDKMSQNARRDLDALKNAYKHGDPVPRFHYETRQFSLVRSCSDLGDNDLELIIIRGINFPLPSDYRAKDLDTFVKFEFPFPNDDPQKGDSDTCKHTDNPEYNQSFKVQMNRKARSFQRILKNKSIKLEVFYKRGFLKGDKLLGTVNIKLLPLENTCVLHDSYDLMDGRKSVGGKLEVKVRIRDPFFNKEVEEVKERWLVIDHFDRKLPDPKIQAKPTEKALQREEAIKQSLPEHPGPVSSGNSMEVLKYEKQLLEAQIQRYRSKLSGSELQALQLRSEALDKEVTRIRASISQGGLPALKAYANSIEGLQQQYIAEAKTLLASGNKDKATVLMTKKKCVEKEVEAIRSKLSKMN